MQPLLKLLPKRISWPVLAGLLSGGVIGSCIMLLGLVLLAPTTNIPPPHPNDTPGDLTIRLSQKLLSSLSAQNVTGVPLGGFSTLPLNNVTAQPEPGDQLFVMGQVNLGLDTRTIKVRMQPCVASGRLALVVTDIDAGGLQTTPLTRDTIQNDVNNATNSIKLPFKNLHLAQVLTTSDAMLLIYSSSGSGGQPSCPKV